MNNPLHFAIYSVYGVCIARVMVTQYASVFEADAALRATYPGCVPYTYNPQTEAGEIVEPFKTAPMHGGPSGERAISSEH